MSCSNLSSEENYRNYVNPQWVKLLTALGLNRNFVRAQGSELYTDEGLCFQDFLSGYGVYNIGHNHPKIIKALTEQLNSYHPLMLQSHIPLLAAQLAEKLCKLAGSKIKRALFTNTGSEGVETAIKFSRAHTKRDRILYAENGFHGLTCGALSLMSNPWWRKDFGSLLPNTQGIPFGNLDLLTSHLATDQYAAFILEPIQGEAGVIIPTKEYLKESQRLCEKHGTLFVLDEVQTGLYRTGTFLAAHHYDLQPDMVILAKALSGGFVPVGALLMREDISDSIFSSLEKAFIHSSTFAENVLAMRTAFTTLDIMQQENLGERSTQLGELLRSQISKLVEKYELLKEVRGLGLFNAIEFQPPASLTLSLFYKTASLAHVSLFTQMILKTLFEDHQILTQIAANNYQTLKPLPPLTISQENLAKFPQALDATLELAEKSPTKFWPKSLEIAKKILKN